MTRIIARNDGILYRYNGSSCICCGVSFLDAKLQVCASCETNHFCAACLDHEGRPSCMFSSYLPLFIRPIHQSLIPVVTVVTTPSNARFDRDFTYMSVRAQKHAWLKTLPCLKCTDRSAGTPRLSARACAPSAAPTRHRPCQNGKVVHCGG